MSSGRDGERRRAAPPTCTAPRPAVPNQYHPGGGGAGWRVRPLRCEDGPEREGHGEANDPGGGRAETPGPVRLRGLLSNRCDPGPAQALVRGERGGEVGCVAPAGAGARRALDRRRRALAQARRGRVGRVARKDPSGHATTAAPAASSRPTQHEEVLGRGARDQVRAGRSAATARRAARATPTERSPGRARPSSGRGRDVRKPGAPAVAVVPPAEERAPAETKWAASAERRRGWRARRTLRSGSWRGPGASGSMSVQTVGRKPSAPTRTSAIAVVRRRSARDGVRLLVDRDQAPAVRDRDAVGGGRSCSAR